VGVDLALWSAEVAKDGALDILRGYNDTALAVRANDMNVIGAVGVVVARLHFRNSVVLT
jgi:hypothetical protein